MANINDIFYRFPTVDYSIDGTSDTTRMVNFFKNYSIRPVIKGDNNAWSNWIIRDEDTIFTLAHRLYGSTKLYWIIASLNEMINPDWEWPLTDKELSDFVNKKYGIDHRLDIHHYESDPSDNIYDLPEGTIVDGEPQSAPGKDWDGLSNYEISHWIYQPGTTVDDKKTLAAATPLGQKSITNWEYEATKNENNRIIKLLRPSYVSIIIQEKESIVKSNFTEVRRKK